MNIYDISNMDKECLHEIDTQQLFQTEENTKKPRILMLYGSLRARTFSALATKTAARLLQALGAETRIFNPTGLPLPDDTDEEHPNVQKLRELATLLMR
jgi:arsenic resistance protein ArsH